MKLDAYRSNIRTLTQSDTTDLPDALCDIFIEEAWRHCAYWRPNWPFYRQQWTYAFVGDGSTSTITVKKLIAGGTTSATVAIPSTPSSIESIFDNTRDVKLAFMDNAEFDRTFRANDTTTGDPRCYAVQSGQWTNSPGITNIGWLSDFLIKLWPIPTSGVTYNLIVNGFREPINFVAKGEDAASAHPAGYYSATASSAEPDMPISFHEAILWYAVGAAFAYLDEGDRSTYYSAKCDNVLALQENLWFRAPGGESLVLNGGSRLGVYNGIHDRLRFDFEAGGH